MYLFRVCICFRVNVTRTISPSSQHGAFLPKSANIFFSLRFLNVTHVYHLSNGLAIFLLTFIYSFKFSKIPKLLPVRDVFIT